MGYFRNKSIVEQTAKALSVQLETVARIWDGQPGACDRLSNILRMIPPKGETQEKAHERRGTAAKVAPLCHSCCMNMTHGNFWLYRPCKQSMM